jgi:sulfate transport system ATP-binding protein
VDIQRDYEGEHGIRVRVQHVFSAGNYGRIALVRLDNGDPVDAEISRVRLAELRLVAGDEAWVVFRHIRLFPKAGAFSERDVASDDATPATVDAGRDI